MVLTALAPRKSFRINRPPPTTSSIAERVELLGNKLHSAFPTGIFAFFFWAPQQSAGCIDEEQNKPVLPLAAAAIYSKMHFFIRASISRKGCRARDEAIGASRRPGAMASQPQPPSDRSFAETGTSHGWLRDGRSSAVFQVRCLGGLRTMAAVRKRHEGWALHSAEPAIPRSADLA